MGRPVVDVNAFLREYDVKIQQMRSKFEEPPMTAAARFKQKLMRSDAKKAGGPDLWTTPDAKRMPIVLFAAVGGPFYND
jgi:hypothetical protein